MMPAVIFFDIDGTLCRYEKNVSARLRECFSKLKENGNKLFLCTGRSPADISDDIYSLGFNGIIACMGAVVIAEGRILQNKSIPAQMLLETVEAMIEKKIPALILGIEDVLRTEFMVPSLLETGVIRSIGDLYRNGKIPEISSLDIEYPSIEYLGEVKTLIEKHSQLVEYSSANGQTRLVGVDKAEAIRLILEMEEYRGMKSVAVGDSQNDIEMLRFVDIGVAMGDSPDELKNVASLCTGTVEEDGVCSAMEYLSLV